MTRPPQWQGLLSPGLFMVQAGGHLGERLVLAPHLAEIDRAISDAVADRGPKRIIVTMPPRHGKSLLCSRFLPAWYLGLHPDRRVILAAYESEFAQRWGRAARDVLDATGRWFGVRIDRQSAAASRWDIAGKTGGMLTAGVGGRTTGMGANLLIVDDPIKNAEDAASSTIRAKLWDWWRSVAYTRLEPGGTAIVIMTRWHEDDLAGRLLWEAEQGGEQWREIRFPALAEDGDGLGRSPGAALWPDRYDAGALEDIRRSVGSYYWAAMYQQRPAPDEGGVFRRAWFDVRPIPAGATRAVRFWDKAASTDERADYTAGVLLLEHGDEYWVGHVVRGRWSSFEREAVIERTSLADAAAYEDYRVVMEQEPGSSGVDAAKYSVRRLTARGIAAFRRPVTGADKLVRARPFASACENGTVHLAPGDWLSDFLDELSVFPNGVHDDQVDAAASGFLELARYQLPVQAAPSSLRRAAEMTRYGIQRDAERGKRRVIDRRPALSRMDGRPGILLERHAGAR